MLPSSCAGTPSSKETMKTSPASAAERRLPMPTSSRRWRDVDKMLTLGSLFDGSGGFPLGAVLTGIEPLWASEIESFPIRVTTKRLPRMKHLGDINKIDGSKVQPVDIVTGGFCCQDLSVAGKRAGLHGELSGLFFQVIRIIKEMLAATGNEYPKFAVLENVPDIYSSNGGLDFQKVLNELVRIKDESAEAHPRLSVSFNIEIDLQIQPDHTTLPKSEKHLNRPHANR